MIVFDIALFLAVVALTFLGINLNRLAASHEKQISKLSADLDEMRAHVIDYANAMNVLAAETGHSSASLTSPTGEYRSSQSYNR